MQRVVKVTNDYIAEAILQKFPESIRSIEESYATLDIVVAKEKIIEIITWFKTHEVLQFNFLTSLCGVHFPDKKDEELSVVYHMHSFINNIRLRIHVFLPISLPEIPTLTGVFAGANWMERETFEFYGVKFDGHPDLRIILNEESMTYHPLRKEYPLIDDSRTDKDDKYFGR
ncbi:MAG: NADH-quinone oxidoreductase subunit C [Saprospiraceae bacterium]|jgi:NADH-quinone oxidoreductase subunit C|nr:NADH-quinone oxidoreductase subunit C [Saprospiraceae bacterium]MBL0099375.1 NADH-quinone oxidoreductase subunit C [Saprospiraceae bacterium]MBP6796138.1 NADH-quinone oxidoreductase subunit C [Saprospiraceae bacterium]